MTESNNESNTQKRKPTEDNNDDKTVENKKIKTNEENISKDNNNKKDNDKNEREKRPFENLEISNYEPLFNSKRELCTTCNKTFKNFCYNCLKVFDSVKEYIPQVKLPIPLDILKHNLELNSKSTALHAKLISPEDVTIYTSEKLPQYENPDRVLLLFPGEDAIPVSKVDPKKYDRVLVIDGTWYQAKILIREPFLQKLQKVTFTQEHTTEFWRFQNLGDEHLATIEAIYYFYQEYEKYCLKADKNLVKSMDNLLYFYAFQWEVIQRHYKSGKSKKGISKRLHNHETYIRK
ncbi:DTW-domain-containing protein [Anaeromyces robustus]|uniref:tRNA-uridine aminocarboxypropyltransferase 1 n=1 Tax=Anaeromyces robustus TaxID=1754192 RepID=A0A1Y1WRK4_9FUNG|nr:DTW-domain-containing protein [Anaeromyces robustus]|eukprot:ORX76015.1 DTW-domain-containing protein [Anaeromyces robustus]